jgi:hypothetical protein
MFQDAGLDSEPDLRSADLLSPITVRLAAAIDAKALRQLAELDSRPLPPGPHLVAERDGRIDAALSLPTGELVADPFHRTTELCELLRCHAGRPRRVRRAARPLPPRRRAQPATS